MNNQAKHEQDLCVVFMFYIYIYCSTFTYILELVGFRVSMQIKLKLAVYHRKMGRGTTVL